MGRMFVRRMLAASLSGAVNLTSFRGLVQLQAEALQLLINQFPKINSHMKRADVMDFE